MYIYICNTVGFPGWFSSKDSVCSARDGREGGLIPGWRRTPEVRNGSTFQYSCLGNPMDKRAW